MIRSVLSIGTGVCICAAACLKSPFSAHSALLSRLLVQTGPPDVVLLHAPHLPVWMGPFPAPFHLQVVDPAGLHAVSGGALRGSGPQAADSAALHGPQPGPHTAGLGEERARGRGHQTTHGIESTDVALPTK